MPRFKYRVCVGRKTLILNKVENESLLSVPTVFEAADSEIPRVSVKWNFLL